MITTLPFTRRRICTIVGCKASNPRWSGEVRDMAHFAGQVAAIHGFAVVTGGYDGVMSAAAEGAKSAGGLTIGILRHDHVRGANPHLDLVLPTGMGIGRNVLTALAADIMVALPGGTGTLEEMAFATDFEKPLLSWGSWQCLPDVPFLPREDTQGVAEWIKQHASVLRGANDE